MPSGEDPRSTTTSSLVAGATAFVAFQLIDHWGNRQTPRPRPRAEVLAAALLMGFGEAATQTAPCDVGEAVVARVGQAEAMSSYVGVLVSELASDVSAGAAGPEAWRQEQARWRAQQLETLGGAGRYAQLGAAGHTVNVAVLRFAGAIAAHLVTGREQALELPGLPRRDGAAVLRLRPVAPRTWRLSPWPLVGRRLTVVAEVREADDAGSQRRISQALRWSLLAAGAPVD